jgi:hypothetical protein
LAKDPTGVDTAKNWERFNTGILYIKQMMRDGLTPCEHLFSSQEVMTPLIVFGYLQNCCHGDFICNFIDICKTSLYADDPQIVQLI